MDRRSFIKLTAVSGTSAALASCGDPDHQLIRFVPDEDIVPGQAVHRPSVCPLCASGCGLTVRLMNADADVMRDGRAGVVQILAAKKLEGHPDHPVNRGGLCARGQAAIQVTYHPDRITQPLRRTGSRGSGEYEAIAWEDALAAVVERLNALTASGSAAALACIGRRGGSHRHVLLSAFLERYGAPAPMVYELFGDDVLRRANGISFDVEQLPTFDLARTRYLLNFGADFLGTWNSPVAQARAYGDMRQGVRGVRGHVVQVEPRMSQTGASADEWVAIRPGTEATLALGIAHVIMRDRLRPPAADRSRALEGWDSGLPDHAPDMVEQVTGVAASRVERMARDFAVDAGAAGGAPPRSVAMVGGAAVGHLRGLFTALAVNALNSLVGAIAQPGGIYFTPQFDVAAAAKLPGRPDGPSSGLAQMRAGAGVPPQLLFVDGVNPVHTAPRGWMVRDTFEQVPFIVSFGSFLDETSVLADLILPDHSFLESWIESVPESGSLEAVVSVAPPAMAALHDTRATPDVLLEIARRLDPPIEFPWQSFEEMLAATVAQLPPAAEGGDAWFEAQEKGGWWGTLPAALTRSTRLAEPSWDISAPATSGGTDEYGFLFLPYPSNQFLDGSLAHLPWLQEMPDPMTSAMWSSWIEINPATAARLGIAQGDVVEVASEHGSLRTAAYLSPGIAPDVVAMPMGQGHTVFTRYASGRGENPVDLLAPDTLSTPAAPAWAATRVKIARVGPPDGRLILFAGGLREHEERGR